MILKKKIVLARDIHGGMKEATAVQKYNCGKGTVHRVKKDLKFFGPRRKRGWKQKKKGNFKVF